MPCSNPASHCSVREGQSIAVIGQDGGVVVFQRTREGDGDSEESDDGKKEVFIYGP